jgi:hypothetical protein
MSDEQKSSSIPSLPNFFDNKTSDNLKPSDIGVTNNVDKSQMNGINEFLESNSLVAKFAFLLFVIFIFIILLSFAINIIAWLFSPASKEKLINGMINASSQMLTFTQDPNISGSKTIYRSNNERGGIEFTWSVWIYINDLDNSSRKYKHVFSKGNYAPDIDGINQPNNAPGLYISKDTNSIIIFMNTFNVIDEQLEIPDIPLNKWVNVIILCRNKILDVYINGIITKSLTLVGVPKQNYGDVYVAMNGGFNGFISNLWYYNYALGILAIQELVKKGPNTAISDNSGMNLKNPDYLSLRWYFSGSDNEYNP